MHLLCIDNYGVKTKSYIKQSQSLLSHFPHMDSGVTLNIPAFYAPIPSTLRVKLVKIGLIKGGANKPNQFVATLVLLVFERFRRFANRNSSKFRVEYGENWVVFSRKPATSLKRGMIDHWLPYTRFCSCRNEWPWMTLSSHYALSLKNMRLSELTTHS